MFYISTGIDHSLVDDASLVYRIGLYQLKLTISIFMHDSMQCFACLSCGLGICLFVHL